MYSVCLFENVLINFVKYSDVFSAEKFLEFLFIFILLLLPFYATVLFIGIFVHNKGYLQWN